MTTKRDIERLIASTIADIGAVDLDQIGEAFGITREELYKTLAPHVTPPDPSYCPGIKTIPGRHGAISTYRRRNQ